jgi:uncharacterized tellurite resistance protein B-like protein
MINRIRAFFVERRLAPADHDTGYTVDEMHLAAAALLVYAATIDDHFDARERAKILEQMGARLSLSAAEAETLLQAAEVAVDDSNQLLGFTRAIKDRFSYEQRVALIEMLWEVAYADGTVDAYESQLMRRIGGLIYVTDRDRGLARKRVAARQRRHGGTDAPPQAGGK